jgi:Mg2+ and Co2+ transporter CorA
MTHNGQRNIISRFTDSNINVNIYVLSNMKYRCPKNGVLTVHYGVEEITVNVRKMLKKFYWTYLLI